MYHKVKKRPMLLIEVILSFTLFALLFGILGFWQRQIFLSSRSKEQAYAAFSQENMAYRRLRDLFLSISQCTLSSSDALCSFVCDRGVYRDPELSGEVAASLCYDTQGQRLELHIHSLRNTGKKEILTLLDRVSGVSLTPLWDIQPNRLVMEIHRRAPGNQERIFAYQFALGAG